MLTLGCLVELEQQRQPQDWEDGDPLMGREEELGSKENQEKRWGACSVRGAASKYY